jgi:hypothetical protein
MDDQSAGILKIDKYPLTASLVEVACEGVKACFVIHSGVLAVGRSCPGLQSP